MKHCLLLFVPRSNHRNLMEGIKKTINKSENIKLNNPWWTVSLHWTWPYVCPGGEYLRDWHRCAGCKGSRQQDQLQKALNLSPGFLHSALGSWISTASLKESEAASPRPHARTMGHQSLAWMWQYGPDHEITSAKFVVCVLSHTIVSDSLRPHGL